MASVEEAVDIGLRVPVFVAVTGVAEETIVAETFQVVIFDSKKRHEGLVIVDTLECSCMGLNLNMEFRKFFMDGLRWGWTVNYRRGAWRIFFAQAEIPVHGFREKC